MRIERLSLFLASEAIFWGLVKVLLDSVLLPSVPLWLLVVGIRVSRALSTVGSSEWDSRCCGEKISLRSTRCVDAEGKGLGCC